MERLVIISMGGGQEKKNNDGILGGTGKSLCFCAVVEVGASGLRST